MRNARSLLTGYDCSLAFAALIRGMLRAKNDV